MNDYYETKTVTDFAGDSLSVRVNSGTELVTVEPSPADPGNVLCYTPSEARKLAVKLIKAAEVAEGNRRG